MIKEEAACVVSCVTNHHSCLNLPRIEATHLVVAFQTSVHHSSIALFSNALCSNLGVDPIGEPPHIRSDLSKLNVARSMISNGLFKVVVEIAIVEEHIGVVIPSVEVSLDRLDRLQYTVKLFVSR